MLMSPSAILCLRALSRRILYLDPTLIYPDNRKSSMGQTVRLEMQLFECFPRHFRAIMLFLTFRPFQIAEVSALKML